MNTRSKRDTKAEKVKPVEKKEKKTKKTRERSRDKETQGLKEIRSEEASIKISLASASKVLLENFYESHIKNMYESFFTI